MRLYLVFLSGVILVSRGFGVYLVGFGGFVLFSVPCFVGFSLFLSLLSGVSWLLLWFWCVGCCWCFVCCWCVFFLLVGCCVVLSVPLFCVVLVAGVCLFMYRLFGLFLVLCCVALFRFLLVAAAPGWFMLLLVGVGLFSSPGVGWCVLILVCFAPGVFCGSLVVGWCWLVRFFACAVHGASGPGCFWLTIKKRSSGSSSRCSFLIL